VNINDVHPHDKFRDDLVEYTLGILDGRARSDLLAHVNTCEECATELAEFTTVADTLLYVVPGAEPPVGFESRVMERIARSRTTVRERPRRARTLVAVAAAVVLLSFAGGWVFNHLTTGTSRVNVTSAIGKMEQRSLLAHGTTVGTVYAYSGTPSWMFVSVDVPSAPNVVKCVVLTESGRRVNVGAFALAHGKGAWGTSLRVPFTSVKSIELTSSSGVVVARLSGVSWNQAVGRWS
jgi:hypothetical protein